MQQACPLETDPTKHASHLQDASYARYAHAWTTTQVLPVGAPPPMPGVGMQLRAWFPHAWKPVLGCCMAKNSRTKWCARHKLQHICQTRNSHIYYAGSPAGQSITLMQPVHAWLPLTVDQCNMWHIQSQILHRTLERPGGRCMVVLAPPTHAQLHKQISQH